MPMCNVLCNVCGSEVNVNMKINSTISDSGDICIQVCNDCAEEARISRKYRVHLHAAAERAILSRDIYKIQKHLGIYEED